MTDETEKSLEGLTPEQLREYWNHRNEDISWKQREGDERQCSGCGAINPCTGPDTCGQCGNSLKRAKRVKTKLFDSTRY